MKSQSTSVPPRTLALSSATVVGVSAMVGTGVFVSWNPAYELAGSQLFIALAIAAVIAALNAISNARLARMFPESGGGYVYGRECITPLVGQLAGWAFLIGKSASASAAALAIGVYVAPGNEKTLALVSIALVLVINLLGIRYSVISMTVLITVVLIVLITFALWSARFAATNEAQPQTLISPENTSSVLAAAGILFVAFAGYARIAVLGSEVKNAARNIPLAIAGSLAVVVITYFTIAAVLLSYPKSLQSVTPLEAVAEVTGYPMVVISLAAVLAAGSALFALLAGLGRMVFAMSAGGHLPRALGALSGKRHVPRRADLVIAVVLVGLTLAGSIGFNLAISALFVLTYYGVVHAASLTRSAESQRVTGVMLRWAVPLVGLGTNAVVVGALFGYSTGI